MWITGENVDKTVDKYVDNWSDESLFWKVFHISVMYKYSQYS